MKKLEAKSGQNKSKLIPNKFDEPICVLKIELDGELIEEIKVFGMIPFNIKDVNKNIDLCRHQLRFHSAMMESSSGMGRAQLK